MVGRLLRVITVTCILLAASTAQAQVAHDESTWEGAAAVELGIFQSINGMTLAAEYCEWRRCRRDSNGYILGGVAIGGGLGVLGGLHLRPHQAMLINSGTWMGMLNAAALTYDDRSEVETKLMAWQLLGTGLGVVSGQLWHPHNARIAMANSAALWSMVVVTLARNAAGRTGNGPWAMGAADLGFLLGLAAWDSKPLPRLRIAAIDVAAAVGMALGAGFGAAATVVKRDDGPMLWGAAGGALTGGLLMALLMPLPDKELNVQVIPQSNGLMLVGSF
jgi:hypothetical protein